MGQDGISDNIGALRADSLAPGARKMHQNAWYRKPATRGFQTTLIKNYSSLRLSDLVDCLETTDRLTVRAIVVARRIDAAIVAEVQVVRVVAVRGSRPTIADIADNVETAIAAAAITRSRIPDDRCRAKLTGEVHAFVGTVVGIVKR